METEKSIQDYIAGGFMADFNELKLADLSNFEDAGVMTDDKGLVVKFKDGSKFYIIVKSKGGFERTLQ